VTDYRYLIVGGGMAAEAAARGIRELDAAGTIGLIGSDPHPPYGRPPLSKALWKGEPEESIWRLPTAAGLELHLGRRVRTLDLERKRVGDDEGREYGFHKLLLATGGAPRRLPFSSDRLIHFRTLDDYRRLRALTAPGRRAVVIGGGFIGSELAAALATNGVGVSLLFPEAGICSRVFPADLAGNVTAYYGSKGVHVLAGEIVAGVEPRGEGLIVRSRGGRTLEADVVVAGLGIEPEVELARSAGLAVDDGIVVDERLRTSHPDVHAAGDVARFPDHALGVRRRVEHEDNANTMGRCAGRAMAGGPDRYEHLPFFYSDLFELGYEAVGETDSRLETIADWREPFREGVVYYLRNRRVCGVLLWNTWGKVDAARELIARPQEVEAAGLRGRL
jgi:NADPH-dependent 2,4-dienoyl-CoA reductase/sulfur reductase-like enzyme